MRKTNEVKILVAITAMALLIGCGSTIPVSNHRYPPVSPESVQILYQEPKRPYEVIALVGTDGGARPFVADVNGLRREAAHSGADAVIVTGAHNATWFQKPSA